MAVHIAYVFDEKYAIYSSISAISAVQHAHEKIIFHCIGAKKDKQGLESFKEELAAHGQEVKIYCYELVNQSFKMFRGQAANHLKYVIPEIVEEKKILYVDGDTLFKKCPSEIFNIDLGGNYVGGVCDYSHKPSQKKGWPTKVQFTSKEEIYINSGMLLLNSQLIRKMDIIKEATEVSEKLGADKVFADQDVINKLFEGRKKIIGPEFNFQIFNGEIKIDLWKKISMSNFLSIVLIHFIGWCKPWMKSCNPLIVSCYLTYGRKLKTMHLDLVNIENLRHRIQYAKMLDFCERYEEASRVKQRVINNLIQKLKK